MSVSIEHVTKLFGNQHALVDINFNVDSGKIIALIGPNGAGKSTLMKIICGLLAPTSGVVKINGKNILQNTTQLKYKLGYLPENNPLYHDLYVKEYLLHIAGLYNLGKTSDKRISEVIGLTGLNPEMNKKIGVLSKGYRQRVGLAQAIIHNPDILILDEPTTGLDPNQIVEIRSLISALGKEKTVILSTHIMQEVEAICHQVIIISKGRIVANDLTGNMSTYTLTEKSTVIIEFSEDTENDIFEDIVGIDTIKKIRPGTWLIETAHNQDIRGELFNFAVKKNMVIISLHRKDKKLEDVFRELTA
jgi:ABC-2 type transport system ATP-binding protein